MKLIPKLIIWLTRVEENNIETINGNKPKNIYCHRNEKGAIVGLLFKNIDEKFEGLTIVGEDGYIPVNTAESKGLKPL